MSTLDQPTAVPAQPVQPSSVQPGGGFCMNVELAWGRFRRALLRRLRPGYVRRMAEKRQGHCANCPHDIIDPRDLKFCRNVCGYWFRLEDDRFQWRGHLGFARAGLAELVLFTLLYLLLAGGLAAAALLVHPAFWVPLALLTIVWLEVPFFFRDPQRPIPTDPNAFLSPADGTVTHVGEVDDPDFPGGRAFRVSIFLSVFNVHVNRLPRTGRVVGLRYFPGAFLDARHSECAVRNEQLWVDLEEPQGRLLRVKQNLGRDRSEDRLLAALGEEVRAGERFGMIKFGSRTELLLPVAGDLKVFVMVGDKVKGGSTILLRIPS